MNWAVNIKFTEKRDARLLPKPTANLSTTTTATEARGNKAKQANIRAVFNFITILNFSVFLEAEFLGTEFKFIKRKKNAQFVLLRPPKHRIRKFHVNAVRP